MSKNVIIGLGNTGTQIIKVIATRPLLKDVKLYSIDSVLSSVDLDSLASITTIPIISDTKCGSGRDRDRGAAMFSYHEELGSFEKMYEDAADAKSPVIVITSSAGGTGSGSVVPLCRTLKKMGVDVIPIIVTPSMEDPDSYQFNTSDLFVDLGEVGIETYNVFRNKAGTFNYAPINNEIADLVELILGKRYGETKLDSIDDQDLDNLLSTSGRFIGVTAKAPDIETLSREIASKLFAGNQPVWKDEDIEPTNFVMTAMSLKSIFADADFGKVFDEVMSRITCNKYESFKNIEKIDNNGECEATFIIAGLPRPDIKIIDTEYSEVGGINKGINRSKRPGMTRKKKATITEQTDSSGNSIKKFNWH